MTPIRVAAALLLVLAGTMVLSAMELSGDTLSMYLDEPEEFCSEPPENMHSGNWTLVPTEPTPELEEQMATIARDYYYMALGAPDEWYLPCLDAGMEVIPFIVCEQIESGGTNSTQNFRFLYNVTCPSGDSVTIQASESIEPDSTSREVTAYGPTWINLDEMMD